ncbi:Uncharacterized protein PBTT_07060 [Plasmodiophora brassicae]
MLTDPPAGDEGDGQQQAEKITPEQFNTLLTKVATAMSGRRPDLDQCLTHAVRQRTVTCDLDHERFRRALDDFGAWWTSMTQPNSDVDNDEEIAGDGKEALFAAIFEQITDVVVDSNDNRGGRRRWRTVSEITSSASANDDDDDIVAIAAIKSDDPPWLQRRQRLPPTPVHSDSSGRSPDTPNCGIRTELPADPPTEAAAKQCGLMLHVDLPRGPPARNSLERFGSGSGIAPAKADDGTPMPTKAPLLLLPPRTTKTALARRVAAASTRAAELAMRRAGPATAVTSERRSHRSSDARKAAIASSMYQMEIEARMKLGRTASAACFNVRTSFQGGPSRRRCVERPLSSGLQPGRSPGYRPSPRPPGVPDGVSNGTTTCSSPPIPSTAVSSGATSTLRRLTRCISAGTTTSVAPFDDGRRDIRNETNGPATSAADPAPSPTTNDSGPVPAALPSSEHINSAGRRTRIRSQAQRKHSRYLSVKSLDLDVHVDRRGPDTDDIGAAVVDADDRIALDLYTSRNTERRPLRRCHSSGSVSAPILSSPLSVGQIPHHWVMAVENANGGDVPRHRRTKSLNDDLRPSACSRRQMIVQQQNLQTETAVWKTTAGVQRQRRPRHVKHISAENAKWAWLDSIRQRELELTGATPQVPWALSMSRSFHGQPLVLRID